MITHILVFLIAILHLYFLVLEMFLWTKKPGLRTFGMTKERAEITAVLAANQGLYNGFLSGGLIWSLIVTEPKFSNQIALYFLTCVILAGAYGGYSVNRRIFFVQAVPAIIAIVCLFL